MLDFEQFYLKTKGVVYQYLYQHVADSVETEDIAQTVYLMALEEWDMLKEHPNPAGWIILTARNLCKGFHRHTYFRKESYEDLLEEVPYIEPAFSMVVMEDLIENVYRKEDWALAHKYFLEGDSAEELAEEMGVSEGAFRTKIYRMKQQLRNYMEVEQEL